MSVVQEGWLKKTDPPAKIVGLSFRRKPHRRYCILKSNGDFYMLEDKPPSDDPLYRPLSQPGSHHPSATARNAPQGAQSLAALDFMPSREPSTTVSECMEDGGTSQTFIIPDTIPQLELSVSGPEPQLESSYLSIPELPMPSRSSLSFSEGGGDSPNPESGSETSSTPEPPVTNSSPDDKTLNSPGRARSFLNSLAALTRKASHVKTPASASAHVLRLHHVVVTGLPDQRISLCVNDFDKVYVLQAESEEAKGQWVAALQRVCAEHCISLEDFTVLKCIGTGGFGKVYKVQMNHNKRTFAMKVMDKGFLRDKMAVDEVLQEVALLQQLRHPFIARLYCSFQTADKLCMLLEYMSGGEVFTLTRHALFPEEVTRLHAAQVTLALSYLHDQGIVYRDLKPENMVLDAQANCVLTDFGLAHRLGEDRRDAFAGSLTYMAPELLQESPQLATKAVDWWALGCMIFEVTTGRHPFMDEEGEVLVPLVLHEEPQLEDTQGITVSDDLRDIVRRFLVKDPALRLQDLSAIQDHHWFTDLRWDAVYSREIQPTYRGLPWRPCVADAQKFDPDAAAQGTHVGDIPIDAAECHFDGFDWASPEILCASSLTDARVSKERRVRA